MCVCLGPARLSNTTLYVGEATRDGKLVHVLGYQNTAQNLAVAATSVPSGMLAGNAMILPFPASEPMGKDNVLDTSGCKNILKDIAEAVKPRSKGFGRSMSFGMDSRSVEVFDTGIYTVVLARDPRDIPAALARVPAEKRPDLKPEIFAAYAEWYPGWQVALCCFNNAEAVEADPLLWWYVPAFPNVLFAPTLDSHTGGVPDLAAEVELDHTIAVGSTEGKGSRISYSDEVPNDVRNLLPSFGVGLELSGYEVNGDFVFFKSDAEGGMFRPRRSTPGENPSIAL
jgi:hypothetical protein